MNCAKLPPLQRAKASPNIRNPMVNPTIPTPMPIHIVSHLFFFILKIPIVKFLHKMVGCQIMLNGNHGYIIVGECKFIRVFSVIEIMKGSCHPEVVMAHGIRSFFEVLFPNRFCLPAHFDSFDGVQRSFGNIDIQTSMFRYSE